MSSHTLTSDPIDWEPDRLTDRQADRIYAAEGRLGRRTRLRLLNPRGP